MSIFERPRRIVTLLVMCGVLSVAVPPSALAQKFVIGDMCKLLTAKEIKRFTGRDVVSIEGADRQCTWRLRSSNRTQDQEEIRALARFESELPDGLSPEAIALGRVRNVRGIGLGKLRGPGDLMFAEVDKGVPGVHTDCHFYEFSLDILLRDGDLQRIGLELGKRALRRFTGPEDHCSVARLLQDQYPGDW